MYWSLLLQGWVKGVWHAGIARVITDLIAMALSLCFQVPAVADHHGITVVISPLLCKAFQLQLASNLTSPFLLQR